MAKWDQIGGGDEITLALNLTSNVIQQKLEANKIGTAVQYSITVDGQAYQIVYMSAKFMNNIWVLLKIQVMPGTWTSPPGTKVYITVS